MTPELHSLLAALENISEWVTQTGSVTPSSAPPKELVAQFEQALQQMPESETPIDTVQRLPGPAQCMPSLHAEASSHIQEEAALKIGEAAPIRREKPISYAEKVNLERSLAGLDEESSTTKPTNFTNHLQELSSLLSQPPQTFSAQTLLRVQYLTGTLRLQAETGTKLSQAGTDCVEQLLDTQS